MQIEATKLIFVMNFSGLDFFKFASRMSQIAQILVSTFKIVRGWGMPRTPLEITSFFPLAIPGCVKAGVGGGGGGDKPAVLGGRVARVRAHGEPFPALVLRQRLITSQQKLAASFLECVLSFTRLL